MASTTKSAPFTQAVVAAMRNLYPEALADRSFDNTGLLLEAPYNASKKLKNSVLLTIDLTTAVADEAIRRKDSCIVAYHPIIFRGLKSLTLNNTQQKSLLRLAAEGISVYSPHTAVDAAPGGLGDWLADVVTGECGSIKDDSPRPASDKDASYGGATKHERSPIKKVTASGVHGAGMGRIVRFEKAVPLAEIAARIGRGMDIPKGFSIAIPQSQQIKDIEIRSVAVCAGSGGHTFSEIDKEGGEVDLLLTGELSHHEALAAIEQGQSVISVLHSNSERGFLRSVMQQQLQQSISEEWTRIRQELDQTGLDEEFEVSISEVDKDPYDLYLLQ